MVPPLLTSGGNRHDEFFDAYSTRPAATGEVEGLLQDLWEVDVWMEHFSSQRNDKDNIDLLQDLHKVDVEMNAARHVEGLQSAWKPHSVQRDTWMDLLQTDWAVEAAKEGGGGGAAAAAASAAAAAAKACNATLVDPYTLTAAAAGEISPTHATSTHPPMAQVQKVMLDLRATDEWASGGAASSWSSALASHKHLAMFSHLLAVDRFMDATLTTRVGPLHSPHFFSILHHLWTVDQEVDHGRSKRDATAAALLDALYEMDRLVDGHAHAREQEQSIQALLDLVHVDRQVDEARRNQHRGVAVASFMELYQMDCWASKQRSLSTKATASSTAAADAKLVDPFDTDALLAATITTKPPPTRGLQDVLELLRMDEWVDGNVRYKRALQQVYDLWQTDCLVVTRHQTAREHSTVQDSMAALLAMDRQVDEAQGFTIVLLADGEFLNVEEDEEDTTKTGDFEEEKQTTASRRSIFSSREKAMAAKADAGKTPTKKKKKITKIKVTTPQGVQWSGTFTPHGKHALLKSGKTGRIANPSQRPAPQFTESQSSSSSFSSSKRAMSRGVAATTTIRGRSVPVTSAHTTARRLKERAKTKEDACNVM